MIKAKHSVWFDILFNFYLKRIFRKHFNQISILGNIPEPDPSLPLIILPNHSTWWDGFLIYLLNKKIFNRLGYLMMLESQLSKYQMFSGIGAYSINQNKSKDILASLSYTVSLLNQSTTPPPLICIFPQGELLPWEIRPLGYQRGLEWISCRYGDMVNLLPLAIRLEFKDEQRPEVFLKFCENYQFTDTTFPGIEWLEKIQIDLLDKLSHSIVNQEKGKILLQGSRSINKTLDFIQNRISN